MIYLFLKMKSIRSTIIAGLLIGTGMMSSCRVENVDKDDSDDKQTPDSLAITIDTSNKKQEMIGFGGALTWYGNWVSDNNKVNEVADLMFEDLGLDIIRFKTWYYPDNYPTNKLVTDMSNSGDNDYAK